MGGFANNAPIVTDGLVFYVDAGNSKSYDGVSGGTTWTDLVGSNNGTLTNMDTNPASGGYVYNSGNGGNIVFDGVDDYVDCGNNSSLDSLGEISIGAIFNFSSTSGDRETVIQKGGFNTDSGMYGLQLFNERARFALWNNGSDNNFFDSTVTINNSTNYVMCTWDGNTMKIYINGTLNSSQAYTPTSTFGNNTRNLGIGKSIQENDKYLGGNVYTAQIYNRALSASEVLQNYNALKNRFV